MLIQFDTAELRSLCEDEALATQKFGSEAQLILAGMADLVSAPSLGELPPGIAEPVEGSAKRFHAELGSYRLTFVPNHKALPTKENGGLDLLKVTRVKIVAIEHHD
jgi:hypothetical protein